MDQTYNLNGGFKPTMKRFADLAGPDFFPTPRWATFALIDNEKFAGDIWESACGDGAMSRVLEETGRSVFSSDLYNRGYGESGRDFLSWSRKANNIVTNPPYNSAEGFAAAGVKNASRKFALLLRLAFLEGANRANTIFTKTPPSRVWVGLRAMTSSPFGENQECGMPNTSPGCSTQCRNLKERLSQLGPHLQVDAPCHCLELGSKIFTGLGGR
jgi:hypothetical protein